MSDDIKSMIKSRRDERYYGSAFEKRSKFTDETRMDAIQHHMDAATDDTPPDEISSMIGDYNRARRDSDLGRSVEDPNPGPKEQRSRDKIYYGANSYVADLQDGKGIDPINQLEPGEMGYLALLDAGYNEGDVARFKEMLDKLSDDSMRRLDAARANAKRISHATGPKMVDGKWYN